MKHLLLIFGILMLGCTTYTEVDERPSPVVEELAPVAEEPRPTVADNLEGLIRIRVIRSILFAEHEGEDFDHHLSSNPCRCLGIIPHLR